MITYRIKGAQLQYKALELSGLDIAEKLDKMDDLATYLSFTGENISLKDTWKVMSTSFYSESPKGTKIPDITVWASSALVMSDRTYAQLNKYIESDGEFLPIEVDGKPHYIFNCLQFGKENPDQTLSHYFEGETIGLETLEFDDKDISSRILFKSRRQGGNALYCTSNFKALCEELGLNGLIFDEDLLSPFIW